jgi:hypothetical protein
MTKDTREEKPASIAPNGSGSVGPWRVENLSSERLYVNEIDLNDVKRLPANHPFHAPLDTIDPADEAVARVICHAVVEAWGDDKDGFIARGWRSVDECVEQDWREWLDDARAAIAAYEAHHHVSGTPKK